MELSQISIKSEEKNEGLTRKQKSALSKIAETNSVILSAYLFGSMASGRARKDSDADIAIRFSNDTSTMERFQIRLELIDLFEDVIDRQVDVVPINDASLVMIHQIYVHGIPLFVRNAKDEERYRILKQKEYFDFRYYLDKDLDNLKVFFRSNKP